MIKPSPNSKNPKKTPAEKREVRVQKLLNELNDLMPIQPTPSWKILAQQKQLSTTDYGGENLSAEQESRIQYFLGKVNGLRQKFPTPIGSQLPYLRALWHETKDRRYLEEIKETMLLT